MVCACCVSLPAVSLVLFTTAAAIWIGARSILRARWLHIAPVQGLLLFMTGALSLILILLATTLGVLDNHDGLRSAAFARLCTSMTRSPELDQTRCESLGLSQLSGEVIEFGPGPGTNFRCWGGESSGITKWTGVVRPPPKPSCC